MTFIIRNSLSLICLLGMVVFSLFVYGGLPEQVPSNYSLTGEVTETVPRLLMATVLPLSFLGAIVLINVLVRLSPEKFSMPGSKYAVDVIVFGTGVLMAAIHVALLLANGDYGVFVTYFSNGMAAFLMITGNVFGKTEPNFFIGMRLPWALASRTNWKVTHRLAGRLMVVSGLLLFIAASLYPTLIMTILLSASPLLIAAFYSPYYYFKFERPSEMRHSQAGHAG